MSLYALSALPPAAHDAASGLWEPTIIRVRRSSDEKLVATVYEEPNGDLVVRVGSDVRIETSP